MKAWVLRGFGDLQMAEVPRPPLQAGWTRIAVTVVQPSVTEALIIAGLPTIGLEIFRRRMQAGELVVPGHEFCGRVVESGRFPIGARVTCRSRAGCGTCSLCRSGQTDECEGGPIIGFHMPGAFAEQVDVPDGCVIPVADERLSDEVIAATQPLTDAVAAVAASQFPLGATVAAIGQGVMGIGCLAAARVSGAGRTVGVDRREESLALARALGASEVVDARQSDPVQAVADLTDGIGADVVFECAGGSPAAGLAGSKSLQQALAMVKPGGTVVQVALHDEPVLVDTIQLRLRRIRYVFPGMTTPAIVRHTLHLVATGLIPWETLLSPPLQGIDQVGEAVLRTREKGKYGLMNPAQVRVG